MEMNHKHYMHLGIMAVLSFIAMYMLMYAMVNAFTNVYASVNQFYMAGLMTAPMIVIELVVMRGMYQNMKLNAVIGVLAVAVGALFFVFIRSQTAVTDTQFLRSMIPHHGGAILMCQNAPVTDPHIQKLCRNIIKNQQAEIDLMKGLLTKGN